MDHEDEGRLREKVSRARSNGTWEGLLATAVKAYERALEAEVNGPDACPEFGFCESCGETRRIVAGWRYCDECAIPEAEAPELEEIFGGDCPPECSVCPAQVALEDEADATFDQAKEALVAGELSQSLSLLLRAEAILNSMTWPKAGEFDDCRRAVEALCAALD